MVLKQLEDGRHDVAELLNLDVKHNLLCEIVLVRVLPLAVLDNLGKRLLVHMPIF